jgi:hypothetical protein
VALLTTQQMAASGTAVTYSAVSASDTGDVSNGRTFLHVKNAGGSPDTVTVITPGTVGGLAIADQVVTVTNATEKFIGPLDPVLYGTAGVATVTHSFTTSVTAAFVTI